VVTLARNLYFLGSCLFAGLTAVFIAILGHASAWQMRALLLFISCHHWFSLVVIIALPTRLFNQGLTVSRRRDDLTFVLFPRSLRLLNR
jgi:hypothetical protein